MSNWRDGQPRECIVCSTLTHDVSLSGGRKHARCADGKACATRRDAARVRPKTEAGRLRKKIGEAIDACYADGNGTTDDEILDAIMGAIS